MKILNSLFRKKKKQNILSDTFLESVKRVIKSIDNISSEIDDDLFYEIISKNTSNEFETNEIYIFLPIVFAQLWIPKARWKNEYDEIIDNVETTKKYDETESFQIIFKISKKYFKNEPLQNTIIQIGGKSAEINAINKLLLDGGKIEDAEITKTKIIR